MCYNPQGDFTHQPAALYRAFPVPAARRLLQKPVYPQARQLAEQGGD